MRTRLTGLPFSTLPQAFGVPQEVRIKSISNPNLRGSFIKIYRGVTRKS